MYSRVAAKKLGFNSKETQDYLKETLEVTSLDCKMEVEPSQQRQANRNGGSPASCQPP